MKTAALIFACLALTQPLHADATAYQALSRLSEQKGEKMLERVFIVRGEGGASQPEEWVVFRGRSDSAIFQTTRIRSNGRIASGTATVREEDLPLHTPPLNFTILNLDTNAAWEIAKREAGKEDFRFNRADYQLTTHPLARVPAWTMRLLNEEQGTLGVITLSGATGEVLNSLKLYRYGMVEVEGVQEVVTIREAWGERASRSIRRWFSRTGSAFGHDVLNASGTTEEIVVERRTRHFSEDSR